MNNIIDDLCDLEEFANDEIKQLMSKGDMTYDDFKIAGEAIDIIKDVETVKAMIKADENDYGYSNRMPYMSDYDYPVSYQRSNTGNRGMTSNRGRGYSRNDEKDQIMMKMDELQHKLDSMR